MDKAPQQALAVSLYKTLLAADCVPLSAVHRPPAQTTTCTRVAVCAGAPFALSLLMVMSPLRVTMAGLGGFAFVLAGWANMRDTILFNPSPSVPSGFYLRSDDAVVHGATVTVRAADVAPDYAALRDFTDAGDRFIKRVAAAGGDEVCASGDEVSINDAIVARREARDAAGRALPTWSGCRILSMDELLLLGDTPDSFDGRYWGPISRRLIEGVWRPIAR